jgi:predicted Zn-ribbon and HTH transcriptional regulator
MLSKFAAMLAEVTSATNHDSSRLITKKHDHYTKPSSPSSAIFVLCDKCYWCATYFNNTRIPMNNNCPQCNANSDQLAGLPIMPNESYTFDYNNTRGVEMEFKLR